MQVHVSNDAPTSVATGALVVPVFADGALDGAAAEVDALLGGAIADILAGGEITGKANETSLVHAKDAPFKRVLVVGLGEREKFSAAGAGEVRGHRGALSRQAQRHEDRDRAARRASMRRKPRRSSPKARSPAIVDTTIYRTEARQAGRHRQTSRSSPARTTAARSTPARSAAA